MDIDTDDTDWGRFLRVRTEIDLTKSLSRGRRITVSGEDFWIPIKYEKLPKLCFTCGKVIHTLGCKGPIANNGVQQFGP